MLSGGLFPIVIPELIITIIGNNPGNFVII